MGTTNKQSIVKWFGYTWQGYKNRASPNEYKWIWVRRGSRPGRRWTERLKKLTEGMEFSFQDTKKGEGTRDRRD